MIEKSPLKNSNKRHMMAECKKLLAKFIADEQLDVLVPVAHFLRDDVKVLLKEHGVEIKPQSRKVKRAAFSSIATSNKFRAKESMLKILRKGKAEVSANTFFYLFQLIAKQWATKRELFRETCGIHTEDQAIRPRDRVEPKISPLDAFSISSLQPPNKLVKKGVMEKMWLILLSMVLKLLWQKL